MSHRDEDGNFWIMAEAPGRCEECGAVEETRPYGKDFKQVCFTCMGKQPEADSRARFLHIATGKPLPDHLKGETYEP